MITRNSAWFHKNAFYHRRLVDQIIFLSIWIYKFAYHIPFITCRYF